MRDSPLAAVELKVDSVQDDCRMGITRQTSWSVGIVKGEYLIRADALTILDIAARAVIFRYQLINLRYTEGCWRLGSMQAESGYHTSSNDHLTPEKISYHEKHPSMPQRQIRTSSLISVTLINVATLLPAKVVHVGTIVAALVVLLVSCICYRLPHQAFPRLTKQITEVESIITLLDDTRFALDARLSLKTLKIELGSWEVEYLGLSALPWTSYPSRLWYVVRGLILRQARLVLFSIASR
ncbi:hypothetical protein C8J56DRAFT_886739 [Mycena floridula]|nr:hypothetical protein C8J56DRAFT_886739 [Mycena floridula]